MQLKKIAYLIGAGATHAEILNLENNPSENFIQRNSLLISNVSRRVMDKAQKIRGFRDKIESVTYAGGALNIELLISLFTSNQIPGFKVSTLKKLVRLDIIERLSRRRKGRFYLHKALLELHSKVNDREHLLGIMSLNYDDILDEAYNTFGIKPDYCHNSSFDKERLPLLKLHGSFNWKGKKINGKKSKIPIIPMGLNKNYLTPPYNFIWSRTFEVLVECDILRVVGCSLSQNDIGLVDLLFKAHLHRSSDLKIEIIDFEETGDAIKNNYGFFPGIIKPKDIEGTLIADERISRAIGAGNPFKIWLKAKAERMLAADDIRGTKYLRRCF